MPGSAFGLRMAGRQALTDIRGFCDSGVVGLRNDRAGGNVAECRLRDSAKRSNRFAPRGGYCELSEERN